MVDCSELKVEEAFALFANDRGELVHPLSILGSISLTRAVDRISVPRLKQLLVHVGRMDAQEVRWRWCVGVHTA